MAFLAAVADGNFTSSSTWGLLDSGTWTSSVTTQTTGNFALTGSYQSGVAFTVSSNLTLTGVLLRINSATVGSGTMSVRIWNATASAAVANTTTTVNVNSNFPNGASNLGWVYIKFSSTASLSTSTNYQIQALVTSATVNVYRKSASATDFTFGLVTSTNQAPATNDDLMIPSEYSGGTNYSHRSILMNNTDSALTLGTDALGREAINLGFKCSFAYSTAASSNFILKCQAAILLNINSIFTVGTIADPIPSTSTAVLQIINGTSNRHTLFYTSTAGGATMSFVGSNIRGNGLAFLGAPISAGANSITVSNSADVSGWKSGDKIAISISGTNLAHFETKNLSADASGTTLNLSTTVTNARAQYWNRQGTQPVPLMNLTKNVTFRGSSSSLLTSIGTSNSSVTAQDAEFEFLTNTLFRNNSLYRRCSYHSGGGFTSDGVNCSGTIENLLVYGSTSFAIINSPSNAITIDGLTMFNVNTFANAAFFEINSTNQSITNVRSHGGRDFVIFKQTDADLSNIYIGNTTSNAGSLFILPAIGSKRQIKITNFFLSNTTGNPYSINASNVLFDGCEFTHQSNAITVAMANNLTFNNCIISGTSGTFNQTTNIASNSSNVKFKSCTFGPVTGQDFLVGSATTLPSTYGRDLSIVCSDCTFNTTLSSSNTSRVNFATYASGNNASVSFHNTALNGTASSGAVQMRKKYGMSQKDTTIFLTQSPSTRITPNNATYTFSTEPTWIPIPAGKKLKVSVYLRKSVVGDGAAFNGGEAELWQEANCSDQEGLSYETKATETTSAANGAWQLVTFTTASTQTNASAQPFTIRVKGTAGWVNVDRWIVEYV